MYRHAAPALVMVGHWGLVFNVTPRGHAPFDVLLVDKASGMTIRARLALALLALSAGFAAVVVVALFARSVLG